MKYTFAALALAALSLANPIPETEAAAVKPPSFKITNVISGGTGCPQGSIDISYTSSEILPIRFGKEFTAVVGPGADPEDSRKNCQINMALSYTKGFQYALYSADYSGFFDLDAGVKGMIRANYYFSGSADQETTTLIIPGPMTGRYFKHDDTVLTAWSPCGSTSSLFNVNAEIALTPISGKGSGKITVNKESGYFSGELYIKWRQC